MIELHLFKKVKRYMRKITIWLGFVITMFVFTSGLLIAFALVPKTLVSFWNAWFLAGMLYAPSYASFVSLIYKNSLPFAFLVGAAGVWVFFQPRALVRLFSSLQKPLATFCISTVRLLSSLAQIVSLLFLAGWMSNGEFGHYNALKPWWLACLLGFCLYVVITKSIFVFFTNEAKRGIK